MDSPIMLGVLVLLGSALVVDSMRLRREGIMRESSQFCTEFGRTYSEGEMMELPDAYRCQRYKCLAGKTTLVSAGCDFNSTCVPMGAFFIDGCSTKQCITVSRNGQPRFQIVVRIPKCKDYQGVCRDKFDHYSDIKDGRLRESCRCSIFAEFAETLCD